jgi:hypothetical protein
VPDFHIKPLVALAACALAALLFTGGSAAAPNGTTALPQRGVLVPGKSLGGVTLGMTKAQVRRAWGTRFGRCRSCADETWYFNYRPFEPQGAGVAFRRGRVMRLFTLWQPDGWRTPEAVVLGAPESEITDTYGALVRRRCDRYTALLMRSERVQTAFYVYNGELWGFGLTRPGASPCV